MKRRLIKAGLTAAGLILLLTLGASPALAEISANPKSMIYHNASCRHYGCKSCTKKFKTADDARKAGYRACKKCGG